LANVKEMGLLWIHIAHIPRGMVGFIIMKKLPHTHMMAANMSIPENERMPLSVVMNYILKGAKDALDMFTSSTKKWLFLYLLSTIVCVVLDLISFSKSVKGFGGEKTTAYRDLAILFVACCFLLIDYYYILWIVTLKYKFPPFIGKAVMKGIIGIVESLHKHLGAKISIQNQELE
jgi:hypothetical protein